VQRESRSSYIVRKMQESRATSPEEQKVNNARVLNNGETLRVENEILRNNIRELQEQLQNAYIRIKELTEPEQMELDV
jgi:hypothetical protein